MSWITIIWSASMGACLVLALMHVLVWSHDWRSWPSLCFPAMVLGIIGMAVCEVGMMETAVPEVFARFVRTGHVAFGWTVFASLALIHFTFGTGRTWLFWTAAGLRLAALTANFTTGSSLHFVEITELAQVPFLGGTASIVAQGVENPWVRIGQFASLVHLVYVSDASLRLWRKGRAEDRRRALLIGGSMSLFFLVGVVYVGLISAGVLRTPVLASFPFFGMVLAISYQMSRELQRTALLAKELEANQRRLALAGSAGRLAFWEWNLKQDSIWISESGWSVFGIIPTENLGFERFMEHVHEDDRSRLEEIVRESIEKTGTYVAEFRVGRPGEPIRWLAASGRVEKNGAGETILFRGFSIDVTARKEAEADAAQQRRELAHLARAGTLGALSGTLAHELNQPLAAILSNAQVGSRRLAAEPPDLSEMGEILADIVEDTKRAGGIVHGMRAMFAKDATLDLVPVDLNAVINGSLSLLHGEIVARKGTVDFSPGDPLPPVRGSFVELQQVLINLILNGLDACRENRRGGNSAEAPYLRIESRQVPDGVVVNVADEGPGIPPENRERIFEPFFSTKSDKGGLGLGLSISRGIVERFGGTLEALPSEPGSGAVFRILLPGAENESFACDMSPDGSTMPVPVS
jgi:two-component system, LuxR family, sensor kinase FixL